MKRIYKKQKSKKIKQKVFVSKKDGISIKDTRLTNNKVKTTRISKEIKEPDITKKIEKRKIKRERSPKMPKSYGNIFYYNNEYLENFICTSFSIILYMKQKSEKGEFL